MAWMFYLVVGLILAAGILTILVKTVRFKPLSKDSSGIYMERDDLSGPQKLSDAIRVPTISYIEGDKIDREAFLRFHALLREQFPHVHERCELTVINGYSLVYRLKSALSEPSGKPILITAHMDVVPVEEGTESAWTEPPFSGTIRDGFVWGRGTLDTKIHLIAALEALELLLENGFAPKRDIYLAFGHDEELHGQQGAKIIAEHFKNTGLEFDFVLDEGGCVATNVIPGIDKPTALVGVGEKGFANLRLTVTRDGGHSSMPARHTSLGLLAQAIVQVEAHPFKPRLIAPTRAFLMRIGPHMKGINRVILANLWLFKPLFMRVFSQMNSGSALLRTTLAVTMAQGSPAPGIIPQKSSAIVNCRILPGDTVETVIKHFKNQLRRLPVDVEPINLDNPSMLSSSESETYRYVERLIEEYCPGAIVAPYLVLAATDARKYEDVCKNVFRFTPYIIDNSDLDKIHGTNECISVQNVNRCIDFFTALFERLI